MSISSRSGARVSKIVMFKILFVLKQESGFTLGLNTVENTDYINFCWNHFLIYSVILALLSPKLNLISHFSSHTNILNIAIFAAPSSTAGGDRHLCLLSFL